MIARRPRSSTVAPGLLRARQGALVLLVLGCQAAGRMPEAAVNTRLEPSEAAAHAAGAIAADETRGSQDGRILRVLPTRAPQPAAAPDPALEPLLELCGPGDAALHRAARKLLQPGLDAPLQTATLTFALRTSGGPYVRPRALSLSHDSFELSAFERPLSGWLSGLDASGTRRCGVAASVESGRHHEVRIVVAEALARLAPLPSQVEPGTRLRLRAQLLVSVTKAELTVLGPVGPPRAVPTRLAGDHVAADFYVDSIGTHLLQLMVDREGGAEPALEAWVGVGEPLADRPLATRAPGESVAGGRVAPSQLLTAMINEARQQEGVPLLTRHPILDRLARAHAEGMRAEGRLAHDLGEGSPVWRVEAAQLASKATGENLARAPTLRRAHRAIWASPSHRANLLAPHFDSVGIGLARDTRGDWWVCELLADRL